ncbi:MAG: lysine transporter LysE [Actinobacteria bacterium HGW-Actinobacteria-7]|nr:MAG: lysine transporter LysE [Actinobacteria bacterium HGW-Actinobacteria-7]
MNAGDLSAALALGAAAFVVGLSGAMSPGPYLTVTITRTVQRGWFSAGLMLVGHALLEGALLVGFAFGLQHFLQQPLVTTVMALAGGAVLLWMGYGLLSGVWSGDIVRDLEVAEHADGRAAPSHAGSIVQGIVVSLSNPYWTLWWATIGLKLASDGLAIGPVGVAAFFLGHQLADWSWYALVIAAASRGKELLTPGLYRSVMGVLAVLLVYIGARFVASGFGIELPWLPF